MPTLNRARMEGAALVASLDRTLARLARPLVDLVPRRIRRAVEKIEQQPSRPIGLLAASVFLGLTILYGLLAGGQIGRFGDFLLVTAGFGIEHVKVDGQNEASEIALLEKLELDGSMISFDVDAAQTRLAELPWVESATVRKFYPGTLAIEIEERKPFALWQRDGEVFLIDRSGVDIAALEESRFSKLPLVVGGGANQMGETFLADIQSEPGIAAQMRAAVLVAERRWDLHLDNGVTVKLPEKGIRQALAQLVRLDREKQLLSRDVVVVDLRLPDRITVRLPEGRSLEDVTSESAPREGRSRT